MLLCMWLWIILSLSYFHIYNFVSRGVNNINVLELYIVSLLSIVCLKVGRAAALSLAQNVWKALQLLLLLRRMIVVVFRANGT